MPSTRRLKFFPSQKPATLSMNLPLIEAVGLFLSETTRRTYSAQFHHSMHLIEYFTERLGPSVRLRQCRSKRHIAPYTQFRRSAGEHPAVIENEIETLRALLLAAQTGSYGKKPVAGVAHQ
jgi:hypothetical protein